MVRKWAAYENTVVKFDAANFDGLEKLWERFGIGLVWICCTGSGDLCCSKVGYTVSGSVKDMSRCHNGSSRGSSEYLRG